MDSCCSLQDAIFLANLPYRKAFYTEGGWQKNISPTDDLWPSFLKNYFKPLELQKAKNLTKDYLENKKSLDLSFARIQKPIGFISYWDNEYPKALASIYDPPPILFYWGEPFFLLSSHKEAEVYAIVGTRRANPLCQLACKYFLEERKGKTSNDLALVSGLAYGVDRMAHLSAIEEGIANIAILGSSIEFVGPKSNFDIFHKAKTKDVPFALLSEFPPRTPAKPYFFPRRNRIIAGLAKEVFVAQAPKKSGALITVRYALEEGRDVLVFDHPAFDAYPTSNDGVRRLLEDGADLGEFPQIEEHLFRKPENMYEANSAQLKFWKQRLQSSSWLGGHLYMSQKKL